MRCRKNLWRSYSNDSSFQLTFHCKISNFFAKFKSWFRDSKACIYTKTVVGPWTQQSQSTNRLANLEMSFWTSQRIWKTFGVLQRKVSCDWGNCYFLYRSPSFPICRSGYCLKTVVLSVRCICIIPMWYITWYLELWILGSFNIKPSHTWSSPRRWARTASTGGCRYKIWLVIRTSWRKIYESCKTHRV